MVTLILCFIFITPHYINFNDKPVERTPHATGVMVMPDAGGGFIYQIDAAAVNGNNSDAALRDALRRIIEPIAGEVEITNVEPVRDKKGHITAYRAWIKR